ncbi:hypothetical protein PC9H_002386 [Pleurotus ostreatus]|uniref:Uncharacterized protein n=1 Tax=Pleurotus ostreatus TaxID=5322 RepID=A0A8H7DKF0_PLEOS|nr:uncharacterized protein PC9H_002386 [Pleurotus ostreatus]KAF7416126.1 hypothetical protein PC9H_002386 [Pleurotus ostreatus]
MEERSRGGLCLGPVANLTRMSGSSLFVWSQRTQVVVPAPSTLPSSTPSTMEQPSSVAPAMDGGSTNMLMRGAAYSNFAEAVAWFARENANLAEPQVREAVGGLPREQAQDANQEAAATIFVEQGIEEVGVDQLAGPSFEDHRQFNDGTSGPMADVFQQQRPAGEHQNFPTAGSYQAPFELARGHVDFEIPSLPLEELDVYGIDARVQEEYNALVRGSEGEFVWEPVRENQMAPEALESSPQPAFRGASPVGSLTWTHSLNSEFVISPAETFTSNVYLFFGHVASAAGPVRSEKIRAYRNGSSDSRPMKPEDWPGDRHWFRQGHLREEQRKLAEAVGAAFATMAPVLLQETEALSCCWDMGRGRQCGRRVTREGLFQHYSISHKVHEVDGRVRCRQIDSEGGTCGVTLTIADMEKHLLKAHQIRRANREHLCTLDFANSQSQLSRQAARRVIAETGFRVFQLRVPRTVVSEQHEDEDHDLDIQRQNSDEKH